MSKKIKIPIFPLVAVVLIVISFLAVMFGWLPLYYLLESWGLSNVASLFFFMPVWLIPLLSVVGIVGAFFWIKRARGKREIAERERKRKDEEEIYDFICDTLTPYEVKCDGEYQSGLYTIVANVKRIA